jgi:hypothetical protein
MSMIGCFRRVSRRDFDRLCADPELTMQFLTSEEEEPDGFDASAQIDVDKAWHEIHYLLNGQAWEGEPPLNFIVQGGREIGEDMGYGPPRAFSAAEVRGIAAALAPIGPASLESRYEPGELAKQQIYPDIWVREGKGGFSFIAGYFEELKDFIRGAAEQGEALVVFLT